MLRSQANMPHSAHRGHKLGSDMRRAVPPSQASSPLDQLAGLAAMEQLAGRAGASPSAARSHSGPGAGEKAAVGAATHGRSSCSSPGKASSQPSERLERLRPSAGAVALSSTGGHPSSSPRPDPDGYPQPGQLQQRALAVQPYSGALQPYSGRHDSREFDMPLHPVARADLEDLERRFRGMLERIAEQQEARLNLMLSPVEKKLGSVEGKQNDLSYRMSEVVGSAKALHDEVQQLVRKFSDKDAALKRWQQSMDEEGKARQENFRQELNELRQVVMQKSLGGVFSDDDSRDRLDRIQQLECNMQALVETFRQELPLAELEDVREQRGRLLEIEAVVQELKRALEDAQQRGPTASLSRSSLLSRFEHEAGQLAEAAARGSTLQDLARQVEQLQQESVETRERLGAVAARLEVRSTGRSGDTELEELREGLQVLQDEMSRNSPGYAAGVSESGGSATVTTATATGAAAPLEGQLSELQIVVKNIKMVLEDEQERWRQLSQKVGMEDGSLSSIAQLQHDMRRLEEHVQSHDGVLLSARGDDGRLASSTISVDRAQHGIPPRFDAEHFRIHTPGMTESMLSMSMDAPASPQRRWLQDVVGEAVTSLGLSNAVGQVEHICEGLRHDMKQLAAMQQQQGEESVRVHNDMVENHSAVQGLKASLEALERQQHHGHGGAPSEANLEALEQKLRHEIDESKASLEVVEQQLSHGIEACKASMQALDQKLSHEIEALEASERSLAQNLEAAEASFGNEIVKIEQKLDNHTHVEVGTDQTEAESFGARLHDAEVRLAKVAKYLHEQVTEVTQLQELGSKVHYLEDVQVQQANLMHEQLLQLEARLPQQPELEVEPSPSHHDAQEGTQSLAAKQRDQDARMKEQEDVLAQVSLELTKCRDHCEQIAAQLDEQQIRHMAGGVSEELVASFEQLELKFGAELKEMRVQQRDGKNALHELATGHARHEDALQEQAMQLERLLVAVDQSKDKEERVERHEPQGSGVSYHRFEELCKSVQKITEALSLGGEEHEALQSAIVSIGPELKDLAVRGGGGPSRSHELEEVQVQQAVALREQSMQLQQIAERLEEVSEAGVSSDRFDALCKSVQQMIDVVSLGETEHEALQSVIVSICPALKELAASAAEGSLGARPNDGDGMMQEVVPRVHQGSPLEPEAEAAGDAAAAAATATAVPEVGLHLGELHNRINALHLNLQQEQESRQKSEAMLRQSMEQLDHHMTQEIASKLRVDVSRDDDIQVSEVKEALASLTGRVGDAETACQELRVSFDMLQLHRHTDNSNRQEDLATLHDRVAGVEVTCQEMSSGLKGELLQLRQHMDEAVHQDLVNLNGRVGDVEATCQELGVGFKEDLLQLREHVDMSFHQDAVRPHTSGDVVQQSMANPHPSARSMEPGHSSGTSAADDVHPRAVHVLPAAVGALEERLEALSEFVMKERRQREEHGEAVGLALKAVEKFGATMEKMSEDLKPLQEEVARLSARSAEDSAAVPASREPRVNGAPSPEEQPASVPALEARIDRLALELEASGKAVREELDQQQKRIDSHYEALMASMQGLNMTWGDQMKQMKEKYSAGIEEAAAHRTQLAEAFAKERPGLVQDAVKACMASIKEAEERLWVEQHEGRGILQGLISENKSSINSLKQSVKDLGGGSPLLGRADAHAQQPQSARVEADPSADAMALASELRMELDKLADVCHRVMDHQEAEIRDLKERAGMAGTSMSDASERIRHIEHQLQDEAAAGSEARRDIHLSITSVRRQMHEEMSRLSQECKAGLAALKGVIGEMMAEKTLANRSREEFRPVMGGGVPLREREHKDVRRGFHEGMEQVSCEEIVTQLQEDFATQVETLERRQHMLQGMVQEHQQNSSVSVEQLQKDLVAEQLAREDGFAELQDSLQAIQMKIQQLLNKPPTVYREYIQPAM